MTRLHPIVFSLILALLMAVASWFFLYVSGDMATRLQWSGGMGALMFVIAWFIAMRVRTKPAKEQFKHRLTAFGFLLLLFGGNVFSDYTGFEAAFMSACTPSAGKEICRCIEDHSGVRIFLTQMRDRPQVALGHMSEQDLLRRSRAENRGLLENAARMCAANPRAR